jgi:Tfp pilus assembly protein PilF
MLARIACAVAASLLVSACATVDLPAQVPADLLPASAAPSLAAGDALALSPAMQRWLDTEIRPQARIYGTRHALMTGLFDRRRLLVEYDSARTRTAAEAFDDRAGNCLSLVLLTASLAQALGLQVTYQTVDTGEGWSRSGEFVAYSGHINVVLGSGPVRRNTAGMTQDTTMVVDFLPPEDLRGHKMRLIDEATVLGMYLNNRAAEALAAGRTDEAAAWVRAALEQAPQFVPAWNTLAVLYRRSGDDARAERALRQALAADPFNTRVMSNLIGLLQAAGRSAEAQPLRERLAWLEPQAPFAAFQRGLDQARAGQWRQARDAFEQELKRDPHYHELHWWMAQAAAQLGDLESLRRHLALARDNAPTTPQQALYGAKLERLRAMH